MMFFCRLKQKNITYNSEYSIPSGLYASTDSGDKNSILFDCGVEDEKVTFEDVKSLLGKDDFKRLHQTHLILFDAIYDINEKFGVYEYDRFSHFLPPEIGKDIRPTDLDKAIEEAFNNGVLQHINQSPRMSMKYDVDLLPTSRVKRYANNYQAHLVAHSECWQQRTLVGIVPKKLLAKVSEDEVVIYENIVFARLLDNLIRYLSGIALRLDQILSFLEEFGHFDVGNKDYRYSDSISKDWGRAFSDNLESADALKLESKKLFEKVKEYRRQLIQIRSDKLYRHIPQNARIPLQLKQTNILMHDKNYRRLAKLWRQWLKGSCAERLSPTQAAEQKRREFVEYNAYVEKTLLQSLSVGPWTCDQDNKYVFHSTGIKLSMVELTPGVWDVSLNNERMCRVLALSEPLVSLPKIDDEVTNTVVVTTACFIDNSANHVVELSPLTIEGKETLTGKLHEFLWKTVVGQYVTSFPHRLPAKASEIIHQTVGHYLSNEQMVELKSMLSREAFAKLVERSDLAHFVRSCPCCGNAVDPKALLHERVDFLRAKCKSKECNTVWELDYLTTKTMSVNKGSEKSGRFAFTIALPSK